MADTTHPRSPGSGDGAPAGPPLVWSDLDGRLFRPEMLMIGATGRNSGKTELACQLVRRHAATAPVVGLKVTTVEEADGACPRGGRGCGVCSSLSEPWLLTREDACDSSKDTARLLASGASEVHWLRVLREALRDGAAELVSTTPPGRVSVCESNSLRHVVEPGLFFQVRLEGQDRFKASARRVADLADRVVVSNGARFDVPLERISVVNGQWALRREAAAVVTLHDAAEHSTSVAPRAASLHAVVDSLRPHVSQVRVVVPAPSHSELHALVDALSNAEHEWTLVAFDATTIVPAGLVNALFRRRRDVDAVVATRSPGVGTPLLGLYHGRVAERARAAVRAGATSHLALAEHATMRALRLPGTDGGPVATPQKAPK